MHQEANKPVSFLGESTTSQTPMTRNQLFDWVLYNAGAELRHVRVDTIGYLCGILVEDFTITVKDS